MQKIDPQMQFYIKIIDILEAYEDGYIALEYAISKLALLKNAIPSRVFVQTNDYIYFYVQSEGDSHCQYVGEHCEMVMKAMDKLATTLVIVKQDDLETAYTFDPARMRIFCD